MPQFISLLTLFALTGCGLDEEKFEEQYAEAYCEWLDGCSKISERHGTMEDCLQFQKIYADENLSPDGCPFDKNEAKACLEEIQENEDCVIEDSIPNECLDVSSCEASDTGE